MFQTRGPRLVLAAPSRPPSRSPPASRPWCRDRESVPGLRVSADVIPSGFKYHSHVTVPRLVLRAHVALPNFGVLCPVASAAEPHVSKQPPGLTGPRVQPSAFSLPHASRRASPLQWRPVPFFRQLREKATASSAVLPFLSSPRPPRRKIRAALSFICVLDPFASRHRHGRRDLSTRRRLPPRRS